MVRILLGKFLGFLLFLFLVGLVNLMTLFIKSALFLQIVEFLNASIVLLIVMSIMFLIADVFDAIYFPFNLPAPLFSAVGGVFVVSFIFRVLEFILKEGIFGSVSWARALISVLVFVIVMVVGYVKIFFKTEERPRRKRHKRK